MLPVHLIRVHFPRVSWSGALCSINPENFGRPRQKQYSVSREHMLDCRMHNVATNSLHIAFNDRYVSSRSKSSNAAVRSQTPSLCYQSTAHWKLSDAPRHRFHCTQVTTAGVSHCAPSICVSTSCGSIEPNTSFLPLHCWATTIP